MDHKPPHELKGYIEPDPLHKMPPDITPDFTPNSAPGLTTEFGDDIKKNQARRTTNAPDTDFSAREETTKIELRKNSARIKWLLILLTCVSLSSLLSNIFPAFFSSRRNAPNENLIHYLEKQRKTYDSIIQAENAIFKAYIKRADDREHRDSITNLQRQEQLIKTITFNIKPLYAQIPSYTGLSKDSLRRLHTARFGTDTTGTNP